MTYTEWWSTFRRAAASLGAATPTPAQFRRGSALRDDGLSPYAAAAEIFEEVECDG